MGDDDLPGLLRAAACGIEEGNVADPHGRRAGLLRGAATVIEGLRRDLDQIKLLAEGRGRGRDHATLESVEFAVTRALANNRL